MAPAIGALSFWVAGEPEHLDLAFPDGLAAKHFMYCHGFEPLRSAVVQVLNRGLHLRYVILLTFHVVQKVRPQSIRYSRRQQPQPGSF